MQVSDTQTGTDATRKSIINSFVAWSREFEDSELSLEHKKLLNFISLHLKEGEGSTIPSLNEFGNKYDLVDMAGSRNHVSNIYEILKDGIPRTTTSWRNLATGVKEESALERELYEKFNCSPSVMARLSNIRKNTTSTPSVVYATEETKINGRNYKRKFYFLIEDGEGRSGSVSTEECPKWHLRRK